MQIPTLPIGDNQSSTIIVDPSSVGDYCINASSNCAGPALLDELPHLAELLCTAAHDAMSYCEPGLMPLKLAIARTVNAQTEWVIPCGSTLAMIEKLPKALGATDVIVVHGDFSGFARSNTVFEVPMYIIDANTGADSGVIDRVLKVAHACEAPLIYITGEATNPLQTVIDHVRLANELPMANPKAILVVDTAYADYGRECSQTTMTKLTEICDHLILLAPASKILFAPGLTSGWMIVRNTELRAKISGKALPYPCVNLAVAPLMRLLENPSVIETARGLVCEARDLLIIGMKRLGFAARVIHGNGPWVIFDAGNEARLLLEFLAARMILVQQQTGKGPALQPNWIRISATVPHEADRIIGVIGEFYGLNE
jgi:histidinol-phosphate/aromatic aminotransferase/cobyric acid decarboxylase-like protein